MIAQDSNILTFREYTTIVKENHPVMYQSQLLDDMAKSTKRIAKGGFDPKFEADWNQKSFSETNYYSLASGAIKVPTWYGIDLKAGYDRNSGQFLNESDFIPTRGLWNAGISVPLGKGLVIDNRRAELKRADIYQSVTDQEQVLMMNELLYEASITYLEWQAAKAYLDIANEGLELASIRLEGTRQSFINGDKPAIDTLESFISLQTRQLDYQKAEQSLDNTTIALNNYLWINGEIPVELSANTRPEDMAIDLLQSSLDSLVLLQDQWIASHPELLMYDYKLANINIDQRLAKEELKPDIRVNYNPLVGVADDALFDQFNANNYKIGATISYPLMQRKQRGKIQLNKIKTQDTAFNRSIKNQELVIKLNTYINNIQQTLRQYDLLDETVTNYNRMLIAENRKLSVGESSIFLVNSRESKYLDSRYKQIEAARKLIFNRLTYLLFSARIAEVI
ncbi:MAG: outer membrane protein TolC [Halioglobus sp.]|jgi:outer membrane protein TolC